MNYYEIRPADRSIPASIYYADTTEDVVRLYCWANAYDRDEVDAADLEIGKVDEDDLSKNERDLIESRTTRYQDAQVMANVDEENNSEAWWAACPPDIAHRLRTETLCGLSLDELFGLMLLPGWYSSNDHAPTPINWTIVRW